MTNLRLFDVYFHVTKAFRSAALCFFALAALCPAQGLRTRDPNDHAWFIYYGDHQVKQSPWVILTEIQVRRADSGLSWQQLLLREGATYRVNPKVQLGGGYGFIRTYGYGDFPVARPFNEHRLFEQAIFRHEAGKLELEHRYRLEQRWLEAFTGTQRYWRYQDRFRYQLRGAYPLTKTNARGQQTYLFGGDEIFLHFGPNYGASAFDQNRAYFGVGFKLTPANRLEFSYLNQFLIQRSGLVEESNHMFRIQLTSTVGLFGKR